MESQNIGIENIKKVLDELFDTSMKTYEALKDGFQWTDTFVLIKESKDVPVILAHGKLALAELGDLDSDETKEIHAWAEDTWNIKDTEIDDRIVEALGLVARIHAWAETGIAIYPDVLAFGKKMLPHSEKAA